MRTILKITIHCLIPILLGGLIYVLFRPTSLRMFQWFNVLGIDEVIRNIRVYGKSFESMASNWLIFSAPDGLWVYSFTSALIIVNDFERKKYQYWLILPLTSGIGVELLQYFDLFKGTFDTIDLYSYILGTLLSICFLDKNILKHK